MKPALPTYATIADTLEKKNGSGLRLVGWTAARSVIIAPAFLGIGVPWKKAVVGSLLASALISLLTYLRIRNAS